jgi:outer membrane lipoprotein SlyB
MKKYLLALPILLAACEAPVHTSGTVYRQSETGIAMPTSDNCTVTSARYVQLIGSPSSGGQLAGTVAGGLLGAALGSQIGGGDGRRIATALGAVGGAAAGSRISSNIENNARHTTGVEYTVRSGTQERVLVQNIGAHDTVLPAGTACRIIGSGNNTRILPN